MYIFIHRTTHVAAYATQVNVFGLTPHLFLQVDKDFRTCVKVQIEHVHLLLCVYTTIKITSELKNVSVTVGVHGRRAGAARKADLQPRLRAF